ncbi:MAG: hypothetical protein BWY72_02512 [Bacteroidetes bacterium ADurb.Bin416]|nr:MAG: hypothetical protein BWY72_02512 [Bacteroidetes bacterium ADurb.Bin416]
MAPLWDRLLSYGCQRPKPDGPALEGPGGTGLRQPFRTVHHRGPVLPPVGHRASRGPAGSHDFQMQHHGRVSFRWAGRLHGNGQEGLRLCNQREPTKSQTGHTCLDLRGGTKRFQLQARGSTGRGNRDFGPVPGLIPRNQTNEPHVHGFCQGKRVYQPVHWPAHSF